ncbi:hypothetical protein HanRHA438_Chr15g0733561 [Helianthus annuus]|nr:hypothetical protein HanRHA438_Chr15g0733561 [Helianthus annuus]
MKRVSIRVGLHLDILFFNIIRFLTYFMYVFINFAPNRMQSNCSFFFFSFFFQGFN